MTGPEIGYQDFGPHLQVAEITVYAWRGHVTVAGHELTIEQADQLANAIAEAQLVAMEQRVRLPRNLQADTLEATLGRIFG